MLGHATQVAEQPWPGRPEASHWRSLPAGQPLGTPAALFPRVELPTPEGA